MKTLSLKQLQVLGSLSTKAYRQLADGGLVCEDYNEWRKTFTFDIVGKDSWKACVQTDFVPLQNAFRAILGMKPKADRTPQTPEQSLQWTIEERVKHWELSAAYVGKIVAERFGRPWARDCRSVAQMMVGMDEETLKHLLWTIQDRARKLAKRESEALGIAPPIEVHSSRSTMPPSRLAAARGDTLAEPLPTPRRRPATATKGGRRGC